MEENPWVSIICACYNQSSFVVESLESVKNQTYKNLEIIIYDDASKDNSVEIIDGWILKNQDLNIRFIKNVQNIGICKSLNNAQSFATGKYIQLLALDDILLPDKIERHVKILEKSQENEALVFTDAYLMDDKSQIYQNKFIAYHKRFLSLKTENYFEDLLTGNFIPAMSILYKKKIFSDIGFWDEDLVFEDYDMLLRIAKIYNFIFDENISVKYRFHENNSHKKLSSKMYKSNYLLLLKHIDHNDAVNKYLKEYIIKSYKNNNLQGEQIKFFQYIKPKNFRDHWLLENKNQKFYKIIEKILQVKNLFIYS
ncbi:glycosyltransferase family 2 protein [Halpernia frigidisoli]|uniref:Glycosyltransferase, GT2 family n=1 Tax=Halpernia frigidisoli TaxID=1125876 RepID=A0A1I3GL50_9FLAO|nr:glycosyltransferase [Halpernia frigidisoli]SFI24198.1 Glycosyltransferase, GT2 family [Halpernia frigidisoli]